MSLAWRKWNNGYDHFTPRQERVIIVEEYEMMEPTRTFINREQTVFVTIWPNGQADVQIRMKPTDEWSMPIRCEEEQR